KEWREFQHAEEFAQAGIMVPEPVYYSEVAHHGEPVVFYATKAFPSNWTEAKSFFKSTRSFAEEWRSLARYTRVLHSKHILHGDYRSDHIYFDSVTPRSRGE